MTLRKYMIQHMEGLCDPLLVTINDSVLQALAPDFSTFSVASVPLPFQVENPRDTLMYILAQTALQYRFWDGFGSAYQRYALEDKVGSAAMVDGFARAWGAQSQPGSAIIDCARAAHALSPEAAKQALMPVFGAIPVPRSRVVILGEVMFSPQLEHLLSALDADFRAGRAGVVQAVSIARAFPRSYGDLFLKKAMLAVGLMVAQYRQAGVSCAESLLAYADYQVPAVMRHLGVLTYAPSLAKKVDSRQHIVKGSAEELAIRAATIIGCERFAQHHGVTAAETDWFFWLKRKEPTQPFHLTATTEY